MNHGKNLMIVIIVHKSVSYLKLKIVTRCDMNIKGINVYPSTQNIYNHLILYIL